MRKRKIDPNEFTKIKLSSYELIRMNDQANEQNMITHSDEWLDLVDSLNITLSKYRNIIKKQP